jgi:hypothetical protein
MKNILIRKWKIYPISWFVNSDMAEEEQQEDKRIRPREQARGQKK